MPAGDPLIIWTVYDHPRDFPDEYVARKFAIDRTGTYPTTEILRSPSLTALRETLAVRGLTRINRSPRDEPRIVECWL